MKSLDILKQLLLDASLQCDADTSRDWISIQSRIKAEGQSFVTITLPRFGSWLEQSLEQEQVLPSIYSSFRKKKRSSSPCFLQGLVEQVFDSLSGKLRDDASPSAVFYIRQICYFHKKVKAMCSKERIRKTIESFVAVDEGLPSVIELDNVCKSVAYVVVSSLNFSDSHEQCFPKHGPGATVEKLWGNQKYSVRDFYRRWTGRFDPVDLYGHAVQWDRRFSVVEEDDEQPCKIAVVPKTMKAPRTIAVEPVAMQYAQQYIGARLIGSMSESPLTKHIDFRRQSVNRDLARKGSIDRSIATIDLSEASDRVSVALVNSLFASDQVLLDSLLAARSRGARLPDGSTLRLKKYSTSGSALTFPVETLVFFIIALSAIVRNDKTPGKSLLQKIHAWSQAVSVYGDDIVVPVESYSCVTELLESLHLKVNGSKSFHKGSFRESCGGDYFRGYDVTPIYLRSYPSSVAAFRTWIASFVSTCNQLYKANCWRAADAMRKYADTLAYFPLLKETSPGLGWHTHNAVYEFSRILPDYGIRVRALCVGTRPEENTLLPVDILLKHFLSKDVQEDPDHSTQSTRQYASRVRLKWITPY